MADDGLTRSLVGMVHSRSVSKDDLRAAERHVRDWLGSFVAGRSTEAGSILLRYGRERVDPEGRAFLAAALSHITETDDLHRSSVTHPGCVVVPVALVLGRDTEARGPNVLRAVLAGYEVMLRIGEALGPGHYRTFHNTATAGVFGAAAAASHLLGLEEDEWVWALGSAGTQAGGLWEFHEEGAMSKPLHAGQAAVAGLRSALLARSGFTGAERILEGTKGFFVGYCPDPDPEAVLRPAAGWRLAGTSLKPYPSCRHTHPAIDAALELRAQLDGETPTADRVEEIRIGTYSAALQLTDRKDPRTPHAARFSLQYCVSRALLTGAPSLDDFEPERIRARPVRALMDRCTVVRSEPYEEEYPRRWGAEVRLRMRNGRTHVARTDSAKGDPESPLSAGELNAKVRSLFAYGRVGESDGARLLQASRDLIEGGPAPALPLVPP